MSMSRKWKRANALPRIRAVRKMLKRIQGNADLKLQALTALKG